MNSFDKIASLATSGMRAQAYRIQLASENIANADTYGYRRKLASFENVFNAESGNLEVRIGRILLDPKPGEEVFDPTNPLANESGYVAKSNVNMLTEFSDVREANRSYEAGLEVFKQARDMYASLLDVLKR